MTGRLLAFLIASVGLGGCSSPEGDQDHPQLVVAPRLAPPPPRDDAIDREQALRLARAADPGDAIAALDAQRFAFPLDDPALAWFGQQGVDPQVLDYLQKRARIDWESTRGDIDPDTPQ